MRQPNADRGRLATGPQQQRRACERAMTTPFKGRVIEAPSGLGTQLPRGKAVQCHGGRFIHKAIVPAAVIDLTPAASAVGGSPEFSDDQIRPCAVDGKPPRAHAHRA